ESHRGVLILVMGILSLVCLPLFWLILPLVIGVVLGLVSWVMGHGDLKKIQANEMDPDGSGLTRGGWICGIIGTCLNALLLLSCRGFFSFSLLERSPRSATTYKQPIQFKDGGNNIDQWDDPDNFGVKDKDFPRRDKGMRPNPPPPPRWKDKDKK